MKKENVVNNILETDFKLNQRPNNEPLRVLSEDDWKFWKDNGYVIIPNAVPQENIDRLVNLIWEFEEKKSKRSGNLVYGSTPRNSDEGAGQYGHG